MSENRNLEIICNNHNEKKINKINTEQMNNTLEIQTDNDECNKTN